MMKKLIIAVILLTASSVASAAWRAYFKHEVIPTTGTIKQCVYDYMGTDYIVMISKMKICPQTIIVEK
jgi:hypothetical protein